jgi:hypothetical protein
MKYIDGHISTSYTATLADIKSATDLVLTDVAEKIECNRYNRKGIAFQIIGDMISLGYKRRVIIAHLVSNLGVTVNYATVLIQKYRKQNGLVEART